MTDDAKLDLVVALVVVLEVFVMSVVLFKGASVEPVFVVVAAAIGEGT